MVRDVKSYAWYAFDLRVSRLHMYKEKTVSQAASQAAIFYRDVAKNLRLWTVEDDDGVPAPKNREGTRCMPLWSSQGRVEKIIKTAPAYSTFRPLEMSWDAFILEWAPDIAHNGMLVGVNWSGSHALGYDLDPRDLIGNVTHFINNPARDPRTHSGAD